MVTNASNQTQYFGFPLFASTDKPSLVTDWNGTVEELDTLLETLRVGISTNESAISALERRVTDIGTEIAEMANTLAVQGTTITDNKTQIDILRETLIEVSATVKSLVNANLEERMATVESSVAHVESELGRVSDDLAELSHTVTTQGTDIGTLQEDLGTLTGRVGTISDDLDAAESDIDALENRADREDVADTRILDTLASNIVEQGVTHAREWAEGTSYVKGDFVQVPKQGVFVCTAGHTASASNKPSINETIHSVVNSQYWTSFAMWLRRMFSKIISEYQTTTEYKKDEYVTYNNNVYKAKSTNTGNLPTDADYWEAVPNLSDGGFCNAIFRNVLALASDVSDMQTQVADVQSNFESVTDFMKKFWSALKSATTNHITHIDGTRGKIWETTFGNALGVHLNKINGIARHTTGDGDDFDAVPANYSLNATLTLLKNDVSVSQKNVVLTGSSGATFGVAFDLSILYSATNNSIVRYLESEDSFVPQNHIAYFAGSDTPDTYTLRIEFAESIQQTYKGESGTVTNNVGLTYVDTNATVTLIIKE